MTARSNIPQAAAVPFKILQTGKVEVLLIRRPGRAWGIPKGLVDPGFTEKEAARVECMEEAGVEGEFLGGPLGHFCYPKFGGVCQVVVFALRVTRVMEKYAEEAFRDRQWFPLAEAAEAVGRDSLRPMIEQIESRVRPGTV